MWGKSGIACWLAADPRRVFAYYFLMPIVGVGVGIYGAESSHVYWLVIGIILLVEGLYILGRYGALAYRAFR